MESRARNDHIGVLRDLGAMGEKRLEVNKGEGGIWRPNPTTKAILKRLFRSQSLYKKKGAKVKL